MPVNTKQRKSSLAHVRAGAAEWSPVFKSYRRDRLALSNRRKYNNRQTQRGRRRSNVVSCFHRTQQYSIIALTDETGNIKERYAYDAYGAPTILDANGVELATSAENNRYMYTGREWDEDLGLYHYRVRMYDPYSGRFCSRDPIGYAGSKYSLYCFVNNAPLRFLGPFGLKECTIEVFGGHNFSIGDFLDNNFPNPNANPNDPLGGGDPWLIPEGTCVVGVGCGTGVDVDNDGKWKGQDVPKSWRRGFANVCGTEKVLK